MRILGNQRSVKATASGALIEDQVLDLFEFREIDALQRTPESRACLCGGDRLAFEHRRCLLGRLHRHFTEPELVELGGMIGLTLGQQSWLRLLNIENHEVMAGTSASMAPGYEDAHQLAAAKGADDYWAKSPPRTGGAA
jgi:hypothetical protein